MATRADRLNERLRGAQRTNLDDDDTFGFDIPGVAAPPPKETDAPIAQRSSSSPKRRRLNEPEPSSANPRAAIPPSSQRRPRRSPSVRAPSVPSIQEEIEGAGGAAARSVRNTTASSSSRHTSSPARTLAIEPAILEEDEFEAQPEPPSTQSPRTRRATQQVVEEEVEESPRDAPGSGRRRRIESVGASASSARLQEFLGSDGSTAFSSSPLAKVARRSTAANARRVTPSAPTRLSRQQNQQESSPERQESAEQEEAEEVDAVEAAQVIGRKRPAQDASRLSPVLGSGSPEPDEAEKDEGPAPKRQRGRPRKSLEPGSQEPERGGTAEKPKRGRGRPSKSPTTKNGPAAALRGQDSERETSNTPKRRPGRPSKSPAVQRQPTQKAKQARPSQPQAAASRASKPKAATKPRKRAVERSRPAEAENESEGEEGEDVSIEITVQRYVNTKSRDDFDEEDPLHMEIPFANRTGESAVDVLSQVCQEVMERTLGQLHELLSATEEPAKKKEYRIKMRAIDAYKEELSARLLQHTIHLDHWHSLKKRLKHVQKEKLSLREEIMRLKAEREQVGLRMDAIRTKHEEEKKEAKYRLDASAMMNDIELAVERGQQAPELPPKALKEAELANLEFMIAQVAEQASSGSDSGGLLKQITEFNGFLERAAQALESRQ